MRGQIKAIPTFYKGVEFRSRLEARWACFFDSASIEWVYEPEGFSFNGKRYLPDFYFPKWKLYAEIKPAQSEEASDICREFTGASGRAIVLLDGAPWDVPENHLRIYDLFCHDLGDSSGGASSWSVYWVGFERDQEARLCLHRPDNYKTLYANHFEDELGCLEDGSDSRWNPCICQYNFDFAKSAKFEHGEKPDFNKYMQKLGRSEGWL